MSEDDAHRSIIGAAQSPSHEYEVVRRHPVGTRVARRIAERHGVVVGPDVRVMRAAEYVQLAGTNAHAAYLSLRGIPNQVVRWSDLFPRGRALIVMHRGVFLSDESIVAHLTHELFEIDGLRQAFEQAGGWMSAADLDALIRGGKVGNLHDQPWDAANRAVEAMRKGRSKV